MNKVLILLIVIFSSCGEDRFNGLNKNLIEINTTKYLELSSYYHIGKDGNKIEVKDLKVELIGATPMSAKLFYKNEVSLYKERVISDEFHLKKGASYYTENVKTVYTEILLESKKSYDSINQIYINLTKQDSVYNCIYYLNKDFDKDAQSWEVQYSNVIDKDGIVIKQQ